MAGYKTYSLNNIPIGHMDGTVSDHRILVDGTDNVADFLLEKQAPDSRIGFTKDKDNPGKFIVLMDNSNPESTEQGTNLRRVVSTFSLQEIDSKYTNLAGSQYSTKVVLFPITISIGKIDGFNLLTVNSADIDYIDRLQIAILSNDRNNIAGSTVEFFGQYGYGDSQDNLTYTGNGKQFTISSSSTRNGIYNLDYNYHFVAILIHFDSSAPGASSMGLFAKSKSGSPLVEIGKNMNYCGQDENQQTMLRTSFIDDTSFKVSTSYSLQTNLQVDFPYIEFNQVRSN